MTLSYFCACSVSSFPITHSLSHFLFPISGFTTTLLYIHTCMYIHTSFIQMLTLMRSAIMQTFFHSFKALCVAWLAWPNFLLVYAHWCYTMVRCPVKVLQGRSPSSDWAHIIFMMIKTWPKKRCLTCILAPFVRCFISDHFMSVFLQSLIFTTQGHN